VPVAKFIIQGGHSLRGTVRSSGSKNAALPIIAATILIDGTVELGNVPNIADIRSLLEIIRGLGKSYEFDGDSLKISGSVSSCEPDRSLTSHLRASLLLMGPLVSKLGKAVVAYPGGCHIGHRPINAHLDALHSLGAKVEESDDWIRLSAKKLVGADLTLPEISVTGTENALLAAVLADGVTTIRLSATEPHVQDLVRFLVSAGADISGLGSHNLAVKGVGALKTPPKHRIIPDGIEAATFAIAAAVTNSNVTIEDIDFEYLAVVLKKFEEVNVNYHYDPEKNTLKIGKQSELKATREFKTGTHPAFPTDLQAPWAVLMTQAKGTSLIHDPMFEGRQGYIRELIRMGADATILDPHRVIITGPTPLIGTDITTLDLRAGATLIIAALVAAGTSTIDKVEIIDRGYENIEKKLQALGANIKRVE
jgi:UDP-N-acetylglucosamine 1-carboxyvinyltransferase